MSNFLKSILLGEEALDYMLDHLSGGHTCQYGEHETNSNTHHAHFEAYDEPGGKVVENTSVEIKD